MRFAKAARWLAVWGAALSLAERSPAQSLRQDVVDVLTGRRAPAQGDTKPKRKTKSSTKRKAKPLAKSKPKPPAKSPAKPSPKSQPAEAPRATEPAVDALPSSAETPDEPVSQPALPAPAPTPELTPALEPSTASAATPAEAPGPDEPPTAPAGLELSMFVDAYGAWQSGGNGTLATLSGHRAFSGQGATFLAENGFSLAFLGFDASYETPRFGATANLRFGQGAPIYHAPTDSESDANFGIDLLTQAYLTWRPIDPLAIDLGMFSTPFGAEVLESWKNLNYTRGALYYYAQPAWHTGLRLAWQLSDAWSLIGFVADGTNLISETQQNSGLDQSPTLGAQVGFAPAEALSLLAGGLFTLDSVHNDDAGFDALADVVATLELGGLRAAFNADFILTRDDAPSGADRHFLGFSLAAGYAFSEAFGVAARGEYLLDDANFDGADQDQWRLLTVTLTTDFKPLPHTPNLILRWDNRWEKSNQDIFGADAKGTADPADDSYEDVWFESVIGVVVTTSP
ncbi:MAG: porin [Deltaproteobacteria bacterium]